jgi:ArsR family transcriptional regulator
VVDERIHIGDCRYVTSALAFAKALGDATRLRVVMGLQGGELCVCELCDALEVSQSTLSTHLTQLREAGVVETRKEGKWIYYGLTKGGKRFTAIFLRHFEDEVSTPRTKRDAKRIVRRLALREDGKCTLGFDLLDRKGGEISCC